MRETFYHEVKIFPWSSKENSHLCVFDTATVFSMCPTENTVNRI